MKKLIECNKDRHCPKTLPKCHEMDRPTFSGKKGYCVFPTCQTNTKYLQNGVRTTNMNCPTLGNECANGSLSGRCSEDGDTCEYDQVLAISNSCEYDDGFAGEYFENTTPSASEGKICFLK